MSKDAHHYWSKKADKLLLNKKIVAVEWMTEGESENLGWGSRPVCLKLDDGTWIFPMRDDEGNDGGALAVGESDTLPVF
tara:strand:- start:302 stop:538 length:237 start_codon:yes stop_codon:yes gene_type:complete